jgi:peptidoglycan/xylan/chitin deacetylase (PgdA/CDA1 family)
LCRCSLSSLLAPLTEGLVQIDIGVGGETKTYLLGTTGERRSVSLAIAECLKDVPEHERLPALDRIGQQSGVAWPEAAPPEYAPLSWEDVPWLGDHGVTFGPHSVTHPILSQTEDVQAEAEIRVSWERLRAETTAVVPVICYPNGESRDFGAREIDAWDGWASSAPSEATKALCRRKASGLRPTRFPDSSPPRRDTNFFRWCQAWSA